MPLTKRSVSPCYVSRHRLVSNVRNNELECVSNGTLANLIRQLSSLSRHAENMFGEIFLEAVKLEHKTKTLNGRLERLMNKSSMLDSNFEEVSLADLHLRKPFKTSLVVDQQSLNRQTLPSAMTDCYMNNCEKPPHLDALNPFRDDNKSGLKFYTNPDYFFELWRQEMLKDTDQSKKTKQASKPRSSGESGKKRRQRQPADQRQKYMESVARTGDIINLPPEYHTPNVAASNALSVDHPPPGMVRPMALDNGQIGYEEVGARVSMQATNLPYTNNVNRPVTSQYMAAGYAMQNKHQAMQQIADAVSPTSTDSSSSRRAGSARPSEPPPAPPPPQVYKTNGDMHNQLGHMNLNDRYPMHDQSPEQNRQSGYPVPEPDRASSPDLPPPPPPLAADFYNHYTAASTSMMVTSTAHLPSPPATAGAPPPPPPPPPPGPINGAVASSFAITKSSVETVKSAATGNGPAKTNGMSNSDLLMQIRDGIQLKKVTRQAEKERDREAVEKEHDVAAILRKRMEDVLGNDESESESDNGSWGTDWDD